MTPPPIAARPVLNDNAEDHCAFSSAPDLGEIPLGKVESGIRCSGKSLYLISMNFIECGLPSAIDSPARGVFSNY